MGGEPCCGQSSSTSSHYTPRDIFVYLPTTGVMKPEVNRSLGDAGIATVNLAVFCQR